MRRTGKLKNLLLFVGIMPSIMNRYFIVLCHHIKLMTTDSIPFYAVYPKER